MTETELSCAECGGDRKKCEPGRPERCNAGHPRENREDDDGEYKEYKARRDEQEPNGTHSVIKVLEILDPVKNIRPLGRMVLSSTH